MELKDFISQTLSQICQGIESARQNTQSSGAVIAPRMDNETTASLNQAKSRSAQMIHFEVLLENREEAGKNGGLKVAAGFFSVGGKANNKEAAAHTHKVSFDVPVMWPELPHGNRSWEQ